MTPLLGIANERYLVSTIQFLFKILENSITATFQEKEVFFRLLLTTQMPQC